ncbi:MAG TPA: hypothetical protein VM910_03115 [Bradyrhizobium sp.]|jgi:hypothetical protein|nr:hypothetical protein [Bradyrhizobium sp.]
MGMEFDPLTALTATGVAGYVAIIADSVARNDFGLSNGQIRTIALIAAMLIAVGLATDFLGRRLGKAK